MLRNYSLIARTYAQVLNMQKQLDDLSSSLMLLSDYTRAYDKLIHHIDISLNALLEVLEFKYK